MVIMSIFWRVWRERNNTTFNNNFEKAKLVTRDL